MLGHHPLLDVLLDRPSFSLALLDESPALPTVRVLPTLADLRTRLPAGLVHAAVVQLALDAPAGVAPLVPGGMWYADSRALTAVCGPAESFALVTDLSLYRQVGRLLRQRVSDAPLLADQLLFDPVPPPALARLSEGLETRAADLDRLETQHPGLRADVGYLLRQEFDPELRVAVDLRPRVARTRAREAADQLAARIGAPRFSLLVCDDPTPVELVSPYAADLAGALQRWAVENEDRITTWGLVEAIRRNGPGTPRDRAALVVGDLLRDAPTLVEERRANERTQGLYLTDWGGATYGVAEVDRLAGLDPALPPPGMQTLAVVAGGGPAFLAAAAGRLLETGRVDRTALVHAVDVDTDRVLVPRAVLTPEDGIRLPESAALGDVAGRLGLSVSWVEPLEITGSRASVSPLALLLGAHRRAWAADRLDADAPCFVALYSAHPSGSRIHIARAQARLNAGRLALSALLNPSRDAPAAQTGSARPGRLPPNRHRA